MECNQNWIKLHHSLVPSLRKMLSLNLLLLLVSGSLAEISYPKNNPFISLISGGQKAEPNQFPYQASLQYKSSGSHFCGGVVIHENWILTAAHCLYG